MADLIIAAITLGLCAVPMIGLGIYQIKSENPAWFYSGEIPPNKEDLTDVKAWNKKHGMMWIIYGIITILMWPLMIFLEDNIYQTIILCIGLCVPLPFMIIYHHYLISRYMK